MQLFAMQLCQKSKAMRQIFFMLLTAALFFSCKKNGVVPGNSVEIYLLKTTAVVTGKCKIDGAASVLKDTAIIQNQDILEYSKKYFQLKLTDAAIERVRAFMHFSAFTGFAVTVDKQVIYYGFFIPNISSSSCYQSITMDIDVTDPNKIDLKLGYPGTIEGETIEDLRNDPKLIAAFKSQGKLR
jgi:hypothetical protein